MAIRYPLSSQLGHMLPLAPVEDDPDSVSLASSQRFFIGEPGDTFVVVADGPHHILAGGEDVEAVVTKGGPWAAGAHWFTLPVGCTHVAVIEGVESASGHAYAG